MVLFFGQVFQSPFKRFPGFSFFLCAAIGGQVASQVVDDQLSQYGVLVFGE